MNYIKNNNQQTFINILRICTYITQFFFRNTKGDEIKQLHE